MAEPPWARNKGRCGLAFTMYCLPSRFFWGGLSLFSAPPPSCKAYPTAILLHDHCAIYAPPPTPSVEAIHHIISVKTISCKSRAVACTFRVHTSVFTPGAMEMDENSWSSNKVRCVMPTCGIRRTRNIIRYSINMSPDL